MRLVESLGTNGLWLLVGAGVGLMFGSELVVFLYGSSEGVIRILELLVPMSVGVGLVWYGFQLRDHEFEPWQIAVLGLAVLVGMGLFVLLATYLEVILSLKYGPPREPISLLLNAMALGALLNLTYAYQYVRLKGRSKRQEKRLDRFGAVLERVSHDLRNPLNVARGYSELVADRLDTRDGIEPLQDALDRIEALVDELTMFAHSDRSAESLEIVDLNDVANETWAVVETASATLVVESDFAFQADRKRLMHLFENLFRNAVEHGSEEVTVRVGPLESGDGFYVADDGHGISSQERTAVFEPGYTTAESGTGLGLNIVAEICEQSGWSIEVAESESGGARFEIRGVSV